MPRITYGMQRQYNYTAVRDYIRVAANGGTAKVSVKANDVNDGFIRSQREIDPGSTYTFRGTTAGNGYRIRLDSYNGDGYITFR